MADFFFLEDRLYDMEAKFEFIHEEFQTPRDIDYKWSKAILFISKLINFIFVFIHWLLPRENSHSRLVDF